MPEFSRVRVHLCLLCLIAQMRMKTQQLPQKPLEIPTFPNLPVKEDRSFPNSMFTPLSSSFLIPPFLPPYLRFSLDQQISPSNFLRPLQHLQKSSLPSAVASMPNLIDAIAASLNLSTSSQSEMMASSMKDLSTKPSQQSSSSKVHNGFLSVEKLLGDTNKSRDGQGSPSSTSSTSSTTISSEIPHSFPSMSAASSSLPLVSMAPTDAASDLFKKLLAASRSVVSSQSPQQVSALPKSLPRGFIPPPPQTWLKLFQNSSEFGKAQENGMPTSSRDASSSSA